ncbi:MAG: IS4 family transposase [Anderseniella sp.]
MRHENSLMSGLLKFIPWPAFERLVDKYGSDRNTRTLSTKNQFVTLLHAQLCGHDSLRAVTTTMSSHADRLYHLGFRQPPQRSTLADANAKRPAALYGELFGCLLGQLNRGQRRRFGCPVHLLDSTTVPLHALSKIWSPDKKRDGAAGKLHVMFDLDGGVPVHFDVSSVRVNDIAFAKAMLPASGTTYVFDMGYYDFSLWAKLDTENCRFVTRLKSHTKPQIVAHREIVQDSSSATVIIADRVIALTHRMKGNRQNPLEQTRLREVVIEIETGKRLRLVTNDLDATAAIIADLYKARWQIELFFKWTKQNLPVRRFLGANENAVRTQLGIAMIAFVLLKLAHAAQQSVPRLLDFTRLIATHLMTNRRFDQLTKPPPKCSIDAQHEMQLC